MDDIYYDFRRAVSSIVLPCKLIASFPYAGNWYFYNDVKEASLLP